MAIDWTRGMDQTPTWWLVDPHSWLDRERIELVTSSTVTKDTSCVVPESATLEMDGDLPPSEVIVRGYVECAQQGTERARPCVATLLANSPRTSWEGTHLTRTLSCRGVLQELADVSPPIGWCAPAGSDPLAVAATACRAHCRAPVADPPAGKPLDEPWVAGDSDTWLSTIRALVAIASHEIVCDAWGRIRFEPERRPQALAPVLTFADDEKSILLPSLAITADWSGIPNQVEVIWSGEDGPMGYVATDGDELAATSLPARGRPVLCRITNPEGIPARPTEGDLRRLAERELSNRVADERAIEFTHGLVWPLPDIGDCVRVIAQDRAVDIQARITRQTITCTTGVTVACTAKWRER